MLQPPQKKEITMKKIYAILLTAVAMAGLPQAMRAQQIPPPPPANWILDNFEIGAGGVSSVARVKNVTLPATPNTDSELIGGSRYIILNPAQNPYNPLTEVQVRPSASASVPSSLVWSVGFGTAAAMDLVYGDNPSPLNLNLTGYDRLRLVFGGLSNALNDLVIVVQQGSGQASQCSLAVGTVSSQFLSDPVPSTVDFPLSAFTAGTNWSDIQVIEIIFQGAIWRSPSS
jgi:hypothetical protein